MSAPKYCDDPDHCTYSDCPTAFCDRGAKHSFAAPSGSAINWEKLAKERGEENVALRVKLATQLSAPREFFVELDSLLSWVMHRGWVIRDPDDRATAERLQRQARQIYESAQSPNAKVRDGGDE